jgi:hypothetical protein
MNKLPIPSTPPDEHRRDEASPEYTPQVGSGLLLRFIGLLFVVGTLSALSWAFWAATHPTATASDESDRPVGTSGYYSSEGPRNPERLVHVRSTSDELKYRGGDLGLATPVSNEKKK